MEMYPCGDPCAMMGLVHLKPLELQFIYHGGAYMIGLVMDHVGMVGVHILFTTIHEVCVHWKWLGLHD